MRDRGSRRDFLVALNVQALLARECGACDTLREHPGSSLPSAHPAGYARTLTTACAALGDEAFAATWEEGRALAPDGILSALGWQDTR